MKRLLVVALTVACTPSLAGSGYDSPDADRLETFLAQGEHRRQLADFEQLLAERGVEAVVPAAQLWRQGTDWRSLKEPAYAVPPRDQWEDIVPTLEVLRDQVVPTVGPVEVVSGFRTERYNQRAGGAKGSRHKWFEAVDVVPRGAIQRKALHNTLLGIWQKHGPKLKVGLGLYSGVRFHIDTHRHRRW